MSTTARPVEAPRRLTALSHGAGCACKLSLDELTGILAGISWPGHEDLLVGLASGDDAAVWRQPDGRVMVATTDFFTPLVDDARDWGRIAATNAVSDVYAMGATPRLALNLVGWPRDLDFDLLRDVLDGAVEVATDAGYVIAGGHSIDSVEPLFGQVVIGDADEADLLTNAGAVPGQAIVLTKPIGTGVVTTALKRSAPLRGTPDTAATDTAATGASATGVSATGASATGVSATGASATGVAAATGDSPTGDSATAAAATGDADDGGTLAVAYRAAVGEMTRLNRDAARIAREHQATAATDVTGFGLLGHLHRLTTASGVAATLHTRQVPLLPHVGELLDAGFVPGGSQRNAEQAGRFLSDPPTDRTRLLLADAQTSGGLLFTVDADRAEDAVAALRALHHRAAVVGSTHQGPPGSIRVVEG
ncbi:MAG: selenide, water dikinase SelD [Nitriliruptoraceae bacterium]